MPQLEAPAGVYATEYGLVSTATPSSYRFASYRGVSRGAGSDTISRFDREQAARIRAEKRIFTLEKKQAGQVTELEKWDKYQTTSGFVVYKRGMDKSDANIDWGLTHNYYTAYQKKYKEYTKTRGEIGTLASKHDLQSIDPQVQQSQLASQRYSLGRGTTPKHEFDYSVARQQVSSDKLHKYATDYQKSPTIIGTGGAKTKYVIGGGIKFMGDWFLESTGAASRMSIGAETGYGAKRQIKERSWETAGLGFDIAIFGGGALYRKGATKSLQKYGVGFLGETSKVGKAFTYVKGKTYTPLKLQRKKLSKLVPIDDAGGLGLKVTGWKVAPKGKGVATESIMAQVGKDASVSITQTSTSRTSAIGRTIGKNFIAGSGATQRLKWSSLRGGGTMISKYKTPSYFAYIGQTGKFKDFSVSAGKIFMEQKRWFGKSKRLEVPFIGATTKSKKFIDEAGGVMFGEKGKGSKNILQQIYQQETTAIATKTADITSKRLTQIRATSTGIKSTTPIIRKTTPNDTRYMEYGLIGEGGIAPQQGFQFKQKFDLKQNLAQDLIGKSIIKADTKIKSTGKGKTSSMYGIKEIGKVKTKIGIKISPKFKAKYQQRFKIGIKQKIKMGTKTHIPIQPPTIKPFFLPKLGTGKKWKVYGEPYKPSKGKHKRKSRYAPSLTGLALRIKQPKKTGKFTGLEIRGI